MKNLPTIHYNLVPQSDKKINFFLDTHKERGYGKGYKPDSYHCEYKEKFAWVSETAKFLDEKAKINAKIGLVYNIPTKTDMKRRCWSEQNQSYLYLDIIVHRLSKDFRLNLGEPLGDGYFFFGTGLTGTISTFDSEGINLSFYQHFGGLLQLQLYEGEIIDEGGGIITMGSCSGGAPVILSPRLLDYGKSENGKPFRSYLRVLLPKIKICYDLSSNPNFLAREKEAFKNYTGLYKKFLANKIEE